MTTTGPTQDRDPAARPVRPLPLALLFLLGLFGNLTAVPLYPGVDCLFGSVGVLLALRMYGTAWGVLGALVAGAATIPRWEHPWAVLIFACEALVVGLLLDRMRRNLVLADAVFWIVGGIPLVLLTYSGWMGLDAQNTWLIALKQAVNGIFNALVADLLLDHTPLGRRDRGWAVVPLQRLLFHLMTVLVLGTALLLTAFGSHQESRRLEDELAARMQATVRGLRPHLNDCLADHLRAVQEIAEIHRPPWDVAAVQQDLAIVHALYPKFHNLYVADARGVTLAFQPPTNAIGEPTVGLDFSDRPYFTAARDTRRPVVSEVFRGRGGVTEHIVTIVAPVVNDAFEGVVVGAVDLSVLGAMLAEHVAGTGMRASLVSPEGEVVASSDSSLLPGARYDRAPAGALSPGAWFAWQPDDPNALPVVEQTRDATLGHVTLTGDPTDWLLIVEAPLEPQHAYMRSRYLQVLGTMLVLTLFALPVAAIAARRITVPLQDLGDRSTDLPHRLEHGEPVDWPRSRVREIRVLTANFRVMTDALRERVAALAAADRAKDDFLAMLGHELRNPLAPIRAAVQLLGGSPDEAQRARFLGVLDRQTRNLTRLVDDLLDLSRITRGLIELRRARMDARDVVRYAVDGVAQAVREAGHDLAVTLPDAPQWVDADATRLEQVVANLLTNAVKYTPPGGRIEVTMPGEAGVIRIRVRDNGVGMDRELLARAFDLFQQGARSLDRSQGGLGIGLTLVRNLVEMHGGYVVASSPGPGQGSTFEVTLPRAAPPEPT